MEVSDLSQETITGTIVIAEHFHHDLTICFYNLLEDCNDDDDFLDQLSTMINSWLNNTELEYILEDIFSKNIPDENEFLNTLKTISDNIVKIYKKQMKNRNFDGYDF